MAIDSLNNSALRPLLDGSSPSSIKDKEALKDLNKDSSASGLPVDAKEASANPNISKAMASAITSFSKEAAQYMDPEKAKLAQNSEKAQTAASTTALYTAQKAIASPVMDQASFSSAANALSGAKTTAQEAPFNSKKVEALKAQIENGTYKPNSEMIADKLLGSVSSLGLQRR